METSKCIALCQHCLKMMKVNCSLDFTCSNTCLTMNLFMRSMQVHNLMIHTVPISPYPSSLLHFLTYHPITLFAFTIHFQFLICLLCIPCNIQSSGKAQVTFKNILHSFSGSRPMVCLRVKLHGLNCSLRAHFVCSAIPAVMRLCPEVLTALQSIYLHCCLVLFQSNSHMQISFPAPHNMLSVFVSELCSIVFAFSLVSSFQLYNHVG